MPATLEFEQRLRCELSELTDLHSRIDSFAADAGLTQQQLFHVKLVTEELFANFVSYGRNSAGTMHVSVGVLADRISIKTRDDGAAFNPLIAESPDTEAKLEDRPIGGLGIFLMMQVGDRLDYRRVGTLNVVTVELLQS